MGSATKDKAKPKGKAKKKGAAAPEVAVTLAQFDTPNMGGAMEFAVTREGVAVADFAPLTPNDYRPRGMTPLLDATAEFVRLLEGKRRKGAVTLGLLLDRSGSMLGNQDAVVDGVNEVVGGLRDLPPDPGADGKVLAVIVTDGRENASLEATKESVAALVADREAEGWTFIFMGANQDAWGEAAAMGYSGGVTGQSVNFTSTPTGTRSAMRDVARHTAGYVGDHRTYARLAQDAGTQRTVPEGEPEQQSQPAPPASLKQAPRLGRSPYDAREALRKARE